MTTTALIAEQYACDDMSLATTYQPEGSPLDIIAAHDPYTPRASRPIPPPPATVTRLVATFDPADTTPGEDYSNLKALADERAERLNRAFAHPTGRQLNEIEVARIMRERACVNVNA